MRRLTSLDCTDLFRTSIYQLTKRCWLYSFLSLWPFQSKSIHRVGHSIFLIWSVRVQIMQQLSSEALRLSLKFTMIAFTITFFLWRENFQLSFWYWNLRYVKVTTLVYSRFCLKLEYMCLVVDIQLFDWISSAKWSWASWGLWAFRATPTIMSSDTWSTYGSEV